MSVNTFFDHIYCINLDKRKDRWERCQEIFEKHQIYDVERFSATEGTNMPKYPDINHGQAGIIDTHINLFKDARDKDYASILIFEDDVELCEDFNARFDQAVSELPQRWNMFYLGFNDELWNQPQVTEHLWLAGGALAIHALGVARHMYQPLLDGINYHRALDLTYMAFNCGPDSFVIRPRLTYQRPDWSDINGHYVNYDFLKDG